MVDNLTHIDAQGRLRMVDVSDKPSSDRLARARGEIRMQPQTVRLIQENKIAKGNVLEAARLAGIMAAKRTGGLIPLCHTLNLSSVEISLTVGNDRICAETEARIDARTGVEMEALVGTSVALLTIYDMCKAVDREMEIDRVRLVEKRGGRSGVYRRTGESA